MSKVQRHRRKQTHVSAILHTAATNTTDVANHPPLSATSRPLAAEDPNACKQHVVATFLKEITKQEDTLWYA